MIIEESTIVEGGELVGWGIISVKVFGGIGGIWFKCLESVLPKLHYSLTPLLHYSL